MPEYFIVANTFAAPIVSDEVKKFIKADTPEQASLLFITSESRAIYALAVYTDANAFEKGEKYLYRWFSVKAAKDWKGSD